MLPSDYFSPRHGAEARCPFFFSVLFAAVVRSCQRRQLLSVRQICLSSAAAAARFRFCYADAGVLPTVRTPSASAMIPAIPANSNGEKYSHASQVHAIHQREDAPNHR